MVERRRTAIIALAACGCSALIVTALWRPLPRLIWNASASAPVGLYRTLPGARVRAGDMVIARLSGPMRLLAARRHYLPLGVPLVKRVVAVAGDRVCAVRDAITLDGTLLVRRLGRDRAGRLLPTWSGCRTLGHRDVLLVMTGVGESFDGRYFGPTPGRDVIATIAPLWVR